MNINLQSKMIGRKNRQVFFCLTRSKSFGKTLFRLNSNRAQQTCGGNSRRRRRRRQGRRRRQRRRGRRGSRHGGTRTAANGVQTTVDSGTIAICQHAVHFPIQGKASILRFLHVVSVHPRVLPRAPVAVAAAGFQTRAVVVLFFSRVFPIQVAHEKNPRTLLTFAAQCLGRGGQLLLSWNGGVHTWHEGFQMHGANGGPDFFCVLQGGRRVQRHLARQQTSAHD